jgi:phosphoribosyl 1,2-cyclic phosphodiesterase
VKIKFWGVRGSVPTPLTANQIKNRISAVVQRICPDDIRSPESRELFLGSLPPDIFGVVGGNTTCIEVRTNDDVCIIFDAGTGIRELGNYYVKERSNIREFHIFFTHFHWDHIQGIPFFSPAFLKQNKVFFYSPVDGFESFIRMQMKYPYFPIQMDILGSQIRFIELNKKNLKIANSTVTWRIMKHPGGCFAYRLEYEGKSVVIATDSEITEHEFKQIGENTDFFKSIDILVVDSQYTLEESINKMDWGHSSYSIDVDLESTWGVRNLVLFHHEPMYDDRKILGIEKLSQWYLNHLENKNIKIMVAIEGLEVEI